ncbi:hypothetical protein [Microbacterium profundi]
MTSQPEFGWAIISFVTVVLVIAAVWVGRVDKKLSPRSTKVYFGSLIGVTVLAVIAGVFAAVGGKNIAVAYAAVIVAGGTFAQILLAVSRKGGGPLIGSFTTVDVVVRKENDDGTTAETTMPIPVGEDDVREALHVTAWGLILLGAIGGIVGAFFS